MTSTIMPDSLPIPLLWFYLENLEDTKMIKEPQRGDMYVADLSPVRGSEQDGKRPVLIIQNNMGNRHSSTVIVAAITSSPKTYIPTHVSLFDVPILEKQSVVLLEQIRTIDKIRLEEYIGELYSKHMREVNNALAISLGLKSVIVQHMEMSLCGKCASQFYDLPDHKIRRVDYNQEVKEPCMFCNTRHGYDYDITTRYIRSNI